MLARRICFIPLRFISKSFVRDKITPMNVLSKKKAKALLTLEKVELSVETDAKRLVKYVCGTNLLQEGGEDVKIKPDSEYPSWLKEISPPVPLDEMETNSKAFWLKLRKLKAEENKYIKSITRTGSVHK